MSFREVPVPYEVENPEREPGQNRDHNNPPETSPSENIAHIQVALHKNHAKNINRKSRHKGKKHKNVKFMQF